MAASDHHVAMTPSDPDRRVTGFERGGLRFDVRDEGPLDGEPIVLLHGWPGGATTWDRVGPLLSQAGRRTLAPDQRGYSAGARPTGRRAYVMDELTADILALLDAAGLERAHVVGHDWGGAVAWALAAEFADRVASLTVLSTPHPRAIAASVRSSDQALRSAYIGLFQLPAIPEALLLARDAAVLRRVLLRSGLPADTVDAYVRRQQEPGALSASLAWYRALPLTDRPVGDSAVPTRFVWGRLDPALGSKAAELTAGHVTGPYQFDRVDGAAHWLPERHADLVAAAILDHTLYHAADG